MSQPIEIIATSQLPPLQPIAAITAWTVSSDNRVARSSDVMSFGEMSSAGKDADGHKVSHDTVGNELWLLNTREGTVGLSLSAKFAPGITSLKWVDVGLDAPPVFAGERYDPGSSEGALVASPSVELHKQDKVDFSLTTPALTVVAQHSRLLVLVANDDLVILTIPVRICIVLGKARSPWDHQPPTTDALEVSLRLAAGAENESEALKLIVRRMSGLGQRLRYDPRSRRAGASKAGQGETGLDTEVHVAFHFLQMKRPPRYPAFFDCFDMSRILFAIGGLIGVPGLRLTQFGEVALNHVRGLGGSWHQLTAFAVHQVVEWKEHVYDAAMVVDGSSDPGAPPYEAHFVAEMTWSDYLQKLDCRITQNPALAEKIQREDVAADTGFSWNKLEKRFATESVDEFAKRLLDYDPLPRLVRDLHKISLEPLVAVVGQTSGAVLFETEGAVLSVSIALAGEPNATVAILQGADREGLFAGRVKAEVRKVLADAGIDMAPPPTSSAQ